MGMDSILVQLQVARTGVAVEKLTREKSAEKRSRQDALQTPGSNRGWTTDYGQDFTSHWPYVRCAPGTARPWARRSLTSHFPHIV
jgi:hypothetical protein